jgi:addiction module RelE/StbE family toxin
MRVRWTAPASDDLYAITRYIRGDNPSAAREVAKTLYDACEGLVQAPHRGRKGRIEGTRELVFPKLPYIAVYRVIEDVVEILHFYHAAQNWP